MKDLFSFLRLLLIVLFVVGGWKAAFLVHVSGAVPEKRDVFVISMACIMCSDGSAVLVFSEYNV